MAVLRAEYMVFLGELVWISKGWAGSAQQIKGLNRGVIYVDKVMKRLFISIILLGCGLSPKVSAASEANVEACLEFVKESENYKVAHKNSHCIKAANEGSHAAQYSVGMGYGFDGNHDLEEAYYRLSAVQGNYAAYMGLGHVLTGKNDEEAVYWYKKYITATWKKPDLDGSIRYVVRLITGIYKKNNNPKELEQWLSECEKLIGDCGAVGSAY